MESMNFAEIPEPRESIKETLERYVDGLEADALKTAALEKDAGVRERMVRRIAIWKTLTVLAIMES